MAMETGGSRAGVCRVRIRLMLVARSESGGIFWMMMDWMGMDGGDRCGVDGCKTERENILQCFGVGFGLGESVKAGVNE